MLRCAITGQGNMGVIFDDPEEDSVLKVGIVH